MNGVHTAWINGLAFAPKTEKYVLSASKDGYMKLWSVEGNCYEVDKFEVTRSKAAVECIATNSTYIFTGTRYVLGFYSSIRAIRLEIIPFSLHILK